MFSHVSSFCCISQKSPDRDDRAVFALYKDAYRHAETLLDDNRESRALEQAEFGSRSVAVYALGKT